MDGLYDHVAFTHAHAQEAQGKAENHILTQIRINKHWALCPVQSYVKCPPSSPHLLILQEKQLSRVGSETHRSQMFSSLQ